MAKVMTKSQVVAHLAEKAGIQKKAAAGILEELVALATKEAKSIGPVRCPGVRQSRKGSPQSARGPQSPDRRADQNPGQDRRKVPLGQSVQRRCCASRRRNSVSRRGPHARPAVPSFRRQSFDEFDAGEDSLHLAPRDKGSAPAKAGCASRGMCFRVAPAVQWTVVRLSRSIRAALKAGLKPSTMWRRPCPLTSPARSWRWFEAA